MGFTTKATVLFHFPCSFYPEHFVERKEVAWTRSPSLEAARTNSSGSTGCGGGSAFLLNNWGEGGRMIGKKFKPFTCHRADLFNMTTRYLIWHLGKIIPFQRTRDVQATGYGLSEQWTTLQDHYIAKLWETLVKPGSCNRSFSCILMKHCLDFLAQWNNIA